MCYSIPGKVVEINDNIVVVDYFGEKKKARNEFYELFLGDYIYAQGGFVVQKIPPDEAKDILKIWREYFFKLQELDLRLTHEPKTLYQIANSTRRKYLGNSCCVHGIIEFSNWCRNNCLYCGIRKDNTQVKRYRMSMEEIIEQVRYAVLELNFKALVLQSGEDLWYDENVLVPLVKKIMEEVPILLILSIGEREIGLYEKLYQAGARAVLLRFETSNPSLYERYRPDHRLDDRLTLIRQLHNFGYLIFTGFLIGLPDQTEQDILNDIELTGSLNTEMFSFGPFIPHPDTPLKDTPKPTMEMVLTTIARTRIMYQESKILVTTALETLDKENGAKSGLLSGGNSLMINLTPNKYRKLYEIYPKKADVDEDIKDVIQKNLNLLSSLGRAPTDLGLGV